MGYHLHAKQKRLSSPHPVWMLHAQALGSLAAGSGGSILTSAVFPHLPHVQGKSRIKVRAPTCRNFFFWQNGHNTHPSFVTSVARFSSLRNGFASCFCKTCQMFNYIPR
jgi:hypothetical protein